MSTEKNPDFDTILVAIDGSGPSQVAATAAVRLAKETALNVQGLYVIGTRKIRDGERIVRAEIDGNIDPDNPADMVEQFKSQGDEALDWLEKLCYKFEVPVTTNILFGGIPEMILEASKSNRLLSIGRRGHVYDKTPRILGENFEYILTHIKVPVLIGGNRSTDFQRVYIVLSEDEDVETLVNWGEQLQRAFSCQFFTSLYSEDEKDPEKASSILQYLNNSNIARNNQLISDTRSIPDIIKNAEDHHIDLLIMEGYRQFALGLRTEKCPLVDVINYSEVMVLAV
jgi:nucleotide-binding universal stress UspA family protein